MTMLLRERVLPIVLYMLNRILDATLHAIDGQCTFLVFTIKRIRARRVFVIAVM